MSREKWEEMMVFGANPPRRTLGRLFAVLPERAGPALFKEYQEEEM